MESVLIIDIPIQMISCTDTDGKITPIRFRFRDKNSELITVTIDKVIKSEQDKSVIGANYYCTAIIYGMRKTFMLRYNYVAHEWRLSRMSL